MIEIKTLLNDIQKYLNKEVILTGWVKNHRKHQNIAFIDFNDGSVFKTIQVVYNDSLINFEILNKIHIGACVKIIGKLINSSGNKQEYELEASNIILLGDCSEDYPLQPQRYSREYLREISYLRPRTSLFQAVFRIRSITSIAIHKFFNNEGFIYLHSPIITDNDGEGAGEMFQVTTFDLNNIPKDDKRNINYHNDFFSKKVGLTVTGQLEGEAFAMAFRKVYTFGPIFRAEKSNTKTHAAEFWMIEPEIAFCDLNDLINLQEKFLKAIIKEVLDEASEEINFLNNFVEKGLKNRLEKLLINSFNRITYNEAIDILNKADIKFENKPQFGHDLSKEHERYLTEVYFQNPVFVTDWPKEIKAFYMKLNNDNKTVAAVDLLVAKAGELMGGSQREESYDILMKKMQELNIDQKGLWWYLNLRKYGGCIHSGFGIGFERLLIFLTGIDNIRDVIPFPRTYGNCNF